MPRGRPKKNIESVVSLFDITEEKKTPEINTKVNKLSKYKCELCGCSVYDSLRIIRLESLTSRANWHRNCKVDKIGLCSNCSKELNDMIDSWIVKKNKSLRKFDIDET